MVYYDCLNFELVSIRLKEQTYLRWLFLLFWFCVSLPMRTWKHILSFWNILFEAMCNLNTC